MFMHKNHLGKDVLELDARLSAITHVNREIEVTEEQFLNAIKAYALTESLMNLAHLSKRIFDEGFPEDWYKTGRGGVRHPSGILLTQFAIEYLASAFMLSKSNDRKKEKLARKDNILGLFNIYHSSLVQGISTDAGLIYFLIPTYFQQFVSQVDPKNSCTRQWYIFCKINNRIEKSGFENLNQILKNKTSLSIQEYTKLCFLMFAYSSASPRFNIGELDETNITGFGDVFNQNKMSAFLKLISTDYKSFRELDKKLNNDLDNKYTKTKLNPLLVKPVIKLGDNDFLTPSITAYITATFKGLFWWFDAYFRNESSTQADKFRKYFGLLFEEYVGDVLKDTYSIESVTPEIHYGGKHNERLFFDWIVESKEKVYLFEVKGYQFPLVVLQTGEPAKVDKEIMSKLIYTIVQMYKRVNDIDKFEELKHFRGKNIIPIAVFYDIPFISTSAYQERITPILSKLDEKYPGIKLFKYYFIAIEELESYYFVSHKVDLDYILEETVKNLQTGFMTEWKKVLQESDMQKSNLLDRSFEEYCDDIAGK